jgi:hypothetical protein
MSVGGSDLRKTGFVLATAVLVAACGSSSSSKTTAKSPPATPSTPTVNTTALAAGLPPASTPITSPTVMAYYAGVAAKAGLTQKQSQQTSDCIIKKFEAAGAKTVGDADKLGFAQGKKFGAECVQQARSNP